MGTMSWMCVAVVGVESLICIKFGRSLFPKPHPDIVIWTWVGFFSLLVSWGIWFYGVELQKQQAKKSD
jgi:hypothetical protein